MPGLLAKDQVGVREDLADKIAVADVKRTPITSMISKGRKLVNPLYEWQMDAFEDPAFDGVIDGEDVTDFENAARKRHRQKSYIQIFRRTAKVSRVAEDVNNVAGQKSEIAKSASKKLVEMKRDQEAAILSVSEHQDDNGSVPWKIRGLNTWIDSSAQSGDFSVPEDFRPGSAQIETTATASLDEDTHVQNLLAAIFDSTGVGADSMYYLVAGSVLRRRFTDMTRTETSGSTDSASRVRTFNGAMGDRRVVNTTTIFEGDFGIMEVVPSNFINWASGSPDTDAGYVIPMDKLNLRYNKMPTVERLADAGGGPRILVESRAGLEVDNPKGFGKFLPA